MFYGRKHIRNATSIYGDLNIINNKYGKMVMELLNTGLDIGIISRTVHNSKLIKIYGWDLTTNLRVTDTLLQDTLDIYNMSPGLGNVLGENKLT